MELLKHCHQLVLSGILGTGRYQNSSSSVGIAIMLRVAFTMIYCG